MVMMMNCFYGMVDRRKAFSLFSSRDLCQRSLPPRISDTSPTGFEPAHNLSSGLIELSCAGSANHYTTARRIYYPTLKQSWYNVVNLASWYQSREAVVNLTSQLKCRSNDVNDTFIKYRGLNLLSNVDAT